MAKSFSKLDRIDNYHEITKECNPEFWLLLQQALLAALHEQKLLDVVQYRHATEQLKKQQKNHTHIQSE